MQDQYEQYRLLFQSVNTKDSESLRKWFLEHDHLSIYDHARIMNKCTKIVREYKIKAGLKGRCPSVNKPPCRKTIGPAEIPADWRTREWLVENLKKYSANALIRSLGISRETFYKLYKTFNIPVTSGNVSKNPCCNRAWIHKHYVELMMSQEECAKLANITRPRFADWLVKFKIPVRANDESLALTTLPLAVKQVITKLRQQDCVLSVSVTSTFIKVRWRRSPPSRYVYSKIKPHHWRLKNLPKILPQFEHDLVSGEGYPAHFLVKKKDLRGLSIFEREVLIRTLVCDLKKRKGWYWPSYPESLVKQDYIDCLTMDKRKFLRNGMFNSVRRSPGKKLLLHFFDTGKMRRQVFHYGRRLLYAIRRLAKQTRDITFFNLIMALCVKTEGYKHRIPSPVVYSAIFSRLGVIGTVLDMHTGSGSRAVACAINGLTYLHRPCQRFNEAKERGLENITNLKTKPWDGKEIVDLIVCDYDFAVGDIHLMPHFMDRAKMIMAYVPNEHKEYFRLKYNPTKIIPIVNGLMDSPNYFFIW